MTTIDPTTTDPTTTVDERTDLLATLAQHRWFLRFTVRDLTDEQAAQRTTASQLCLGGLIKHVADAESHWIDFIIGGPDALPDWSGEWKPEGRSAEFQLLADENLASVLERYEQVARRTDEVVAKLADLGASQPLPEAPWFESGARWSARRAVLHIITETAQHAGHADIIRESLDGAKTMG